MVILLVILLVLSALFSSSETAFACVNKIRLKHRADMGDKRADRALKIADKYEDALTAILVGNNIANIGSSSLATVLFTQWVGDAGPVVSTVIMTLLVLTFCEVLPKSYAKSHAEELALAFASALSGLIIIMKPFVKIFDVLSRVFKSENDIPSVTEDELKYIIDEIEEEGVLEEQESDLVLSALQFDETTVNNILIPRVKTVGIPLDADLDKIKDMFLSSHFSRFPVYDKTLDNIVGIITNKEFFRLLHGMYQSLDEIMQDVIYVPATKRISEILQDMKKSKTHMAVVVDQYGGTKGIVTLEDILEELVGDIYDESDEILNEFVKTAPHTYEIEGSFSISDMKNGLDDEDIPEKQPEAASTSVGGWVTEILGCIPDKGAKAQWERFHFTVLEADNLTVSKVRLWVEPLPENTDRED
ncbi:MAG: hemolysin family protein [Oscillospiraceae bacterium]|nr:hemolysin family protein [Oscillospiraceae bacterium]